MPRTKVIAKKDLLPYFKKGDKVTIVPILYDKDTIIVNEIHGLFVNGVFRKIAERCDLQLSGRNGYAVQKIADPLYAPKGSYKDSYIELEDGRQYPSSIVRSYNDYFDKI